MTYAEWLQWLARFDDECARDARGDFRFRVETVAQAKQNLGVLRAAGESGEGRYEQTTGAAAGQS